MDSRSKFTFFNELGTRYQDIFGTNKAQILFVKESLALLASLQPAGSRLSILDAGCGTGLPTGPLITTAGHELHGIDFSSVCIDTARQQVPGASFSVASLQDFSPSDGKTYEAVFAIFSLFSLSRPEMEELAERWGHWVKPGGYLFIGSMDVESFPEGTEFDDRDEYGGRAKRRFMGDQRSLLVWTQKGWNKLLGKGSFELLRREVRPFQPPPEADGDWEPHLYLTCRKQ